MSVVAATTSSTEELATGDGERGFGALAHAPKTASANTLNRVRIRIRRMLLGGERDV